MKKNFVVIIFIIFGFAVYGQSKSFTVPKNIDMMIMNSENILSLGITSRSAKRNYHPSTDNNKWLLNISGNFYKKGFKKTVGSVIGQISDTSDYEIRAFGGYTINKYIVVGLWRGYFSGTAKTINVNNGIEMKSINNLYKAALFFRFYPFEKIKIFTEVFIGQSWGDRKEKYNDIVNYYDSKNLRLTEIGISPGIVLYSFKKLHTSIEIKYGWFGYSSMTTINKTGIKEKIVVNNFRLSLRPETFTVGISYNFKNKNYKKEEQK